ncbi:hypothetical protein BGZ76_005034, partial [Entomortierella beljakovae]
HASGEQAEELCALVAELKSDGNVDLMSLNYKCYPLRLHVQFLAQGKEIAYGRVDVPKHTYPPDDPGYGSTSIDISSYEAEYIQKNKMHCELEMDYFID